MRSVAEVLERRAAAQRARTMKLRLAVLAVFGGACVCCDERRMVLLSIDHRDGDGAEHRRWIAREFGGYSGQSFYRGLLIATRVTLARNGRPFGPWSPEEIRAARPASFQVLCRNCQAAKGCGAGECPCRTLATFAKVMSLTDEDDLVSSVIGSVSRRGSSSQSAAGGDREGGSAWSVDSSGPGLKSATYFAK